MSNITIRHDPSQGVPHLFARTVPPPLVEEESVSSISLHTILMRWIVETKGSYKVTVFELMRKSKNTLKSKILHRSQFSTHYKRHQCHIEVTAFIYQGQGSGRIEEVITPPKDLRIGGWVRHHDVLFSSANRILLHKRSREFHVEEYRCF
jgi:hypothetical protein